MNYVVVLNPVICSRIMSGEQKYFLLKKFIPAAPMSNCYAYCPTAPARVQHYWGAPDRHYCAAQPLEMTNRSGNQRIVGRFLIKRVLSFTPDHKTGLYRIPQIYLDQMEMNQADLVLWTKRKAIFGYEVTDVERFDIFPQVEEVLVGDGSRASFSTRGWGEAVELPHRTPEWDAYKHIKLINADLMQPGASGEFKKRLTFCTDADIYNWVAEQPAVKARPIVNGRWITMPGGKVKCSICEAPNKNYQSPFCPHCGAEMDADIALKHT